MTDYILVSGAALSVSFLTLYSGFGLGTLLMPVFALLFPVEVAVGATAVVHAANNVAKVTLLGGHADRSLVTRFGVPAVIAAFAGAALLAVMSDVEPWTSYTLGTRIAVITPLKVAMGVLILIFSLFELVPRLREIRVDRRYLALGGVLSGFFGGFSGHQGALRSAFLVRVGGSPESFVGTNAVIAVMVDGARLLVYGWAAALGMHASALGRDEWPLVLAGIVAALCGVMLGKRLLRHVAMRTVHVVTGILLLGVGLGLAAGMI